MTIVILLSLGLTIGILSGTLGIGGGILLVPALMWLASVDDQRRAAGISLLVLTPPIVLPAVFQYYARSWIGAKEVVDAAWIALGFAAGTYGGAVLAGYLPVAGLRLLFGLLLIFVAVRFLLASDRTVAATAFGLAAAILTGLAYLGLRFLGQRHLPRPDLGEHIRAAAGKINEPGDFSI